MPALLIIIGPTAVGKSTLALALAEKLNGEIISGDSIQVYKHLNIGSAKPTISDRKTIPHHLVDFLELDEPYSAAQFQLQASRLILDIQKRGRIPIVVGGTGLYVRSLTDPYNFAPVGSDNLRQKWQDYLQQYGQGALHQALKERDEQSAERLHPNDTHRIMRALEVFDQTGQPLSMQRDFHEQEYPLLPEEILFIGLTSEREELYRKIDTRCCQMLQQGLLEETLNILKSGFTPYLKPLQSIGYRHAIWHLYGLATQEEMLRLMQRDTRRFAKRQLTWFKRDPRIQWFDLKKMSPERLINLIEQQVSDLQTK